MKKLLLSLIFLAILLNGCSLKPGTEWGHYVPDSAKCLTVYTSHPEEVYLPVITEFEKRTGVWVKVETGSTLDLLNQIESEKENPACDVMFGGNVDSLDSFGHLFAPYTCEEADSLLPGIQSPDHTWTPVSMIPLVLIYNPKLVRNNPPTSLNSLLDYSWKGEIAFSDPASSSFSYSLVSTLLQQYPETPEKTLKELYTNLDGQLLDSFSQCITEVANGNCYIGINQESNVLMGIRKGFDLAMCYPEGGTSIIPDGAAIISGSSHEENARLFLDFLISTDVQNHLQETCARRSVRNDIIPTAELSHDITTLPYDIAWSGANHSELLALWDSICKEVQP